MRTMGRRSPTLRWCTVYVIESRGVLIAVVDLGEMTAWVDTLPAGMFQLCTVWCVNEETGQAVRVTCETF